MYLNTKASDTHTPIPASHDHTRSQQYPWSHQKREEIELQCEAVGGDPTGRDRWPVFRRFAWCFGCEDFRVLCR